MKPVKDFKPTGQERVLCLLAKADGVPETRRTE